MSIRSAILTMAGASALALPGFASAQSTPPVTSQQRIRVQKESPMYDSSAANRIAQARMDSIANAERMRRDSIDAAAARTRDSLATIERARAEEAARLERERLAVIAAAEARRRDSINAVEAAAAAERARIQREKDRYRFDGSGWYLGLEAGGSVPNDEFKDLGYNSGYAITVPIGWQKRNRLLGVRMDLGYTRFSGSNFIGQGPSGSTVTLTNRNPKVLSAVLNLTAQLPLGSKGFGLYALGGGGVYHFRDLGTTALSGYLGNDVLESNEAAFQNNRNKFGVQGGAGIDFGHGPASIYLESRFVNVFADRDDNVKFEDFYGSNRSQSLQWIPIVLGVKIR
jgi:hypothetical protein